MWSWRMQAAFKPPNWEVVYLEFAIEFAVCASDQTSLTCTIWPYSYLMTHSLKANIQD